MKEFRGKEREEGNLKKVFKNEIGITLIALIVTVIIMLIIAGVAISVLTSGEGLFEKTQLAVDTYNQAVQDESDKITSLLNQIDEYINGVPAVNEEQNHEIRVNAPKMTTGMIAVKYNTTEGKWVKADESNENNDWYNYAKTANGNAVAKQWANMVTVKENGITPRADYVNAEVGTVIEMDDILTMFVWIPRYAYSITNGYKQVMDGTTDETTAKIDIKFLVGTTDKDVNNKEYLKDYDASNFSAGDVTTTIVHPAFTWADTNGTPVELEGIWVAKFEASGVNDLNQTDNWTNYVGNGNATVRTPVVVSENTVLTVKPSVPSWRDITTGDAQTQSMKLTNSTVYGWETNKVDGHLMKNTEWGVVVYLCYSEYGNIPMSNGAGNVNGWKYDMVTGGGPKTSSDENWYVYDSTTFATAHSYSTQNGKLASTTGNIYGIYDMNGGACERVAAYLDNKNYNLKKYAWEYFEGTGETTVDSVLKLEYEKYWDSYQVGFEEMANEIEVEPGERLTQTELWDSTKYQLKYNEARKRITTETANNMSIKKGDAMYERMADNEFSFYAPYNSGTSTTQSYDWFKDACDEPTSNLRGFGKSWNGDYVLIGHCVVPFLVRGGAFNDGIRGGICHTSIAIGSPHHPHGFRPVLAF